MGEEKDEVADVFLKLLGIGVPQRVHAKDVDLMYDQNNSRKSCVPNHLLPSQ